MKLVPNLLDDTYIKPIDDSKMFYITMMAMFGQQIQINGLQNI